MNKMKSVVRLAAVESVPSREQLREMLKSAQQNKSCVLLMPWTNDEQKIFVLGCAFDLTNDISLTKKEQDMIGEPKWTLHAGLDANGPVVWNHTTGDVDLVLSFLQMENSSRKDDGPSVLFTAQTTVDQSTIPTKTMAGTNLSGDLAQVQISNVLDSIKSAKMSGRLDISTNTLCTEVYFNAGQPVHADLQKTLSEDDSSTTGDRAFLEMLTWTSGTFKFHRGRTTKLNTITRKLDELCKAASCLQDYDRYLQSIGLTNDSYIVRVNASLTGEEFDAHFKEAMPSYLKVVRSFYSSIDNVTTLYEILNRTQLCRTAWLPIVHKLHSLKLIAVAAEPGNKVQTRPVPAEHQPTPQSTNHVKVDVHPDVYLRLLAALNRNRGMTEADLASKAINYFLDQQEGSR